MTSVLILRSILIASAAGYLAGAVPFGLILGKSLRGIDIREHGSKNLGATNALRVLGAPIGAAVLALDFAKGLLPTLAAPGVATWFASPAMVSPEVIAWCSFAAAISAVLGHVFPVYLGFRGGKGVATGAGVLAALAPLPTLIAFGAFGAVVLATRIVSLGSITAALALPLALLALEWGAATGASLPPLVASLAIMSVVLARHRANLGRILAGTEPRLRGKSPSTETAGERRSPHAGPSPEVP